MSSLGNKGNCTICCCPLSCPAAFFCSGRQKDYWRLRWSGLRVQKYSRRSLTEISKGDTLMRSVSFQGKATAWISPRENSKEMGLSPIFLSIMVASNSAPKSRNSSILSGFTWIHSKFPDKIYDIYQAKTNSFPAKLIKVCVYQLLEQNPPASQSCYEKLL